MKRFLQYLCLVLVCLIVLAIPVSADSRSTDASNYFAATSAYLKKVSDTSFQVCAGVTAVDVMDELGVSYIEVQESSDGVNWDPVHTRSKGNYTSMVKSDAYFHNYNFTYYGTSGYQYRAYVEFYAKKGNGTAYYDMYTETFP